MTARPGSVATPADSVAAPRTDAQSSAQQVRLAFADAWGEMGLAWGVQPSVARVHGYFLAHGGALTERDVREALGLSHRAASIALAECEAWGLIERTIQPRRSGQRGPSATAYRIVGHNWEWFRRTARARKERETDPVLPILERCAERAAAAAAARPDDPEIAALGERLVGLLAFVRLFDRAVEAVVRSDAATIGHAFDVLDRLSDETLDRVATLSRALTADELAAVATNLSRLPPRVVRRLAAVAAQPQLARLLGAR